MAKVSIIVPIYKVEKFLSQCIESCINQTYSDIEILLINDGSPDKSGEICKEYAKKDERIIYIYQENAGVSAARNNGIKNSSGEWLVFVDGDDWIEPDLVEILLNNVESNDCDGGICAYLENTEKNETVTEYFHKDIIFSNDEERKILIKKTFSSLGVPWAKVYSKKTILKNNLEYKVGLKRMQDSIFNFYFFENASKVAYINKPLYHYRQFNDSACFKYTPDFEITAKKIINETEEFLGKYNIRQNFLPEINNRKIKLFIETIKLVYIQDECKIKFKEKINKIKQLKKEEIYNNISMEYISELNLNYRIGATLLNMHAYVLFYLYYKTIYIIKKKKRYK